MSDSPNASVDLTFLSKMLTGAFLSKMLTGMSEEFCALGKSNVEFQSTLRDDINVMSAAVMRMDKTLQGLARQVGSLRLQDHRLDRR